MCAAAAALSWTANQWIALLHLKKLVSIPRLHLSGSTTLQLQGISVHQCVRVVGVTHAFRIGEQEAPLPTAAACFPHQHCVQLPTCHLSRRFHHQQQHDHTCNCVQADYAACHLL
jgi:hypothetical protein